MAQRRIQPGEVVNLYDPQGDQPNDATLALMKTSDMEAIRMVLPKGKDITEHSVDGEVTFQCIEGEVKIEVDEVTQTLKKGDWMYLGRHQSHSLHVVEDSVLLTTILFIHPSFEEEE